MTDWLARAAATRPDAPAVITADRTVTYAELDRAASGVATIIRSSGSFGSKPVAVWGERSIEAVAALWGIPRAGVPAVVVDPRTEPASAMALTRAAGVRGLWTPPDGGIERLMARSKEPGAVPDVEKPRYILFTSGTEGTRRGVVLTGTNIESSVAASRERLGNGPDHSWLAVLPLFHVGGLSVLWRQAEAAAPVVMHARFEAETVADALSDVAYASLVPVMLRRVLDRDERKWSGARAVLVGGAAIAPDELAAARRRGLPVVPTYGMTETCSQVATPGPDEPLDGTVGPPLNGAEIRVSSEGRLEIRGSMLSPGYIGEEARASDWFTTGDLGSIDERGRIRVHGRADDVIVSGGENVHPHEVERLVMAHPDVRAVRVTGAADDEWGQRIVAEVVGAVDIDELSSWAEHSIPPHLRPREWGVVPELDQKLGDV